MSTRRDLIWILVLAVLAVGLQIAFKKRPDAREISRVRDLVRHQDSYQNAFAPDFDLTQLDGRAFKLSEHLGRNVVVLNFFATWCGPCRREMPELEYFAKKNAGKPLVFLAIGVGEGEAELKAYRDELKLTFPLAADTDRTVAGKYQVPAFPTTVVVSPQGRILLYETGAIANADVSLTPVTKPWLELAAAAPMALDEYRNAAPAELPKLDNDADEDRAGAPIPDPPRKPVPAAPPAAAKEDTEAAHDR
jgi:cytochrome c biogenesis protein CcmG, thiol:disulfide interchange protein DsbE